MKWVRIAALAAVATTVASPMAFGAGATHTLTTAGTTWTGSTWTNGTPDGTTVGDVATYGTATTAASISLDADVTIGKITLTNTGNWSITGSTNTFTLNNTGGTGNAAITNTSTGTLTINPNLTISGDLDISSASTGGGTITLGGTITGTGNVSVFGNRNGTLVTLNSVNNTGTFTARSTGTSATSLFVINGGIGANVTSLIVGDAANPSFVGRLNVAGTSAFTGPITIQGGGNLAGTNASLNMSDSTNGITFGTGGGTLTATASGGGITTSKAVTVNGTAIFNNLSTDAITLNGVLSGTGGIVRNTNSGTLVLSNTNTFAGPVTVQGGTLSFNSIKNVGTASALGQPTTVANGTIKLGTSTTTGTLLYTGAGDTTDRVVDLSGTSTFGGVIDTTGNTGALVFTSAFTNSGASALKTLTLQGTSTAANSIVGIADKSATEKTALTKSAAGTWILSGASSYTGATTITSGTLQVDGTLGATAITMGATGGTPVLRVSNPAALTSATLATTAVAAQLQLRNDADATFGTAGLTVGTALAIDVDQSTAAGTNRTLTLGGAISLGAFTITTTNAGAHGYSLGLGNITATGATAGLTVTSGGLSVAGITGGTVANTFTIGGASNGTVAGAIADGTAALSLTKAGAGTWTLAGNNTYTGATSIGASAGTLKIGNGSTTGSLGGGSVAVGSASFLQFNRSDAITVANPITGAGSVQQSGPGSLTLSSATNAFSGGLTITGGSVVAGNANSGVLGSGPVAMANGTSINLAGNSPTIGLLTTTGDGTGVTITNNVASTASTLTVNSASSGTFAGSFNDGAGSVALVKSGSGTLTLTGSSNYSGLTTLNAGVVNIQNGAALGTTANGVTVAAGTARLELQGGITVSGEPLSLSQTADQSAATLRSVVGNNAWTGPITASVSGITRIQADADTLTLGNITTTGASQFVFQGSSATVFGNIVVNGVISGTAPITKGSNSPSTLTLAGANTYTGNTQVSNGTLTITGSLDPTVGSAVTVGASGNTTTLNLNAANAITQKTVTIGATGSAGAFLNESVDNALSGAAALTVTTAGTANLSKANNFTGATTVSNATGTLNLSAAGAISASTVTFTAGTLNLTAANALSGTAALTLSGPSLTLNLANNYSGTTTITGGTLNLGVNGAIGTGPLALNGGTLAAGAGPISVSNVTSLTTSSTIGAGQDITFASGGSFTLSGNNRTLTVNNNTTFAGSVYLSETTATGRTLTVGGSGTATVSGVVANTSGGAGTAGGLVYSGSGKLVLNNTNTYTGTTTATAGLLLINGSVAGAAAASTTGTIGGSGTVAGALTITGTGTIAPGNAGPGVLSVGGAVTFGSTGNFAVEIAGNVSDGTPNSYDALRLTGSGAATLGGSNLSASITGGYVPSQSDVYYILSQSGSTAPGTFAGLLEGASVNLGNGYSGTITYQANWNGSQGASDLGTVSGNSAGNDVAIYNVVPEPASIGMVGLAAVGLLSSRRRRSRSA